MCRSLKANGTLSGNTLIQHYIIVEKQTYSYDEAYDASLDYFKGDELAARVWVNKYAVKDSFGHIYEKSPEDMHWRIANEVARIERQVSERIERAGAVRLVRSFQVHYSAGKSDDGHRE